MDIMKYVDTIKGVLKGDESSVDKFVFKFKNYKNKYIVCLSQSSILNLIDIKIKNSGDINKIIEEMHNEMKFEVYFNSKTMVFSNEKDEYYGICFINCNNGKLLTIQGGSQ